MSNFFNDTIARQIARGEVFFGTDKIDELGVDNPFGSSVSKDFIFTTGAIDTRLNFGIVTATRSSVIVYETVTTSSDGVLLSMINLNRASANTTNATMHEDPTISTKSGVIVNISMPDGELSSIAPFNTEGGMIMAASTKYLLRVFNHGTSPAAYSFSWFTRESS